MCLPPALVNSCPWLGTLYVFGCWLFSITLQDCVAQYRDVREVSFVMEWQLSVTFHSSFCASQSWLWIHYMPFIVNRWNLCVPFIVKRHTAYGLVNSCYDLAILLNRGAAEVISWGPGGSPCPTELIWTGFLFHGRVVYFFYYTVIGAWCNKGTFLVFGFPHFLWQISHVFKSCILGINSTGETLPPMYSISQLEKTSKFYLVDFCPSHSL